VLRDVVRLSTRSDHQKRIDERLKLIRGREPSFPFEQRVLAHLPCAFAQRFEQLWKARYLPLGDAH
jgi:hypothetical protein